MAGNTSCAREVTLHSLVKTCVIVACTLVALLLSGCAGTRPTPQAPPQVGGPAAQAVTVVPQSDWSEAVLYFVITDRWADGDLTNDADVDRSAKGTFHGGDLEGLREHLDEIAGLGATAIWITPTVKNIDGFVTGAGFPDWAYHGYWADDFTSARPALRQRSGAQGARGRVPPARDQGPARRRLQPRRLRVALPQGPADPRAGCAPKSAAPAGRTT